MNLMLSRSLVFVGIMVAGLAFYALWFNVEAERYDETALPYLNQAVPSIASWDFNELEPLLSPQAKQAFRSEQGRVVYQRFTQLGQYLSMDKPQYLADKSDNSEGLGNIRIVSYTVAVNFETGPAIIKLNLAKTDNAYYIHHFGIHSAIYTQKPSS